MGRGVSDVFGGLARAHQHARHRRAAYAEAAHQNAIAEDEGKAVEMLLRAYQSEKARADREAKRADDLAREVARLRLASLRRL
jgi:hypothetical protein